MPRLINDNTYEELGYLQTSGTQYFAPDFTFNCDTDEIEYNFEWVSISGNAYDKVFGVIDDNTGAILHQWDYRDSTNTQSVAFGYNTPTYKHSLGNYALNTNYHIILNKNGVTINDNYIAFDTIATNSIARPYYICALNNNGSALQHSRIRIKNFIHRRSGEILHDLIPVRHRASPTVMGLLDLSDPNRTMYGNAGTGSFGYGLLADAIINPENSGTIAGTGAYPVGSTVTMTAIPNNGYVFEKWISNRYYLLTAIEGTGTQYIKTNIIPNSNTQIELKFAYTVTSGNGYNRLFGTQVDGVGKTVTIRQLNSGNGNIYFEVGNSNGEIAIDTNWHEIIFNNQSNQTIVDGNTLFTNPISNNITGGLWIFANNNITNDFAKAKIEYLKVYNKTTTKYEHILIPVLDYTDLTPGLLDLVEMKFYRNSGTGSFIAYESGSGEYVSITDNPIVINNISNSLELTAQFKRTANCRYKVNGAWKNAMMYIKQNGTWKPGTPKIKINGNWKEGG